jgi:hypothetical protein
MTGPPVRSTLRWTAYLLVSPVVHTSRSVRKSSESGKAPASGTEAKLQRRSMRNTKGVGEHVLQLWDWLFETSWLRGLSQLSGSGGICTRRRNALVAPHFLCPLEHSGPRALNAHFTPPLERTRLTHAYTCSVPRPAATRACWQP